MAIFFIGFFLFPLSKLLLVGASGEQGWAAYGLVLTEPRYWRSLLSTALLAALVTVTTLFISGIAGVFLARHQFRGHALLTALLTLPLAFPGVVIGFMIIMLGGRQGVVPKATEWLTGEPIVFAYSMVGLFVGYIYFSIPRTILTILAAAEKLDPKLEEAARSLGANSLTLVVKIIVPALQPALLADLHRIYLTGQYRYGSGSFILARLCDLGGAGDGTQHRWQHRRSCCVTVE
jgi:putative spermidine/putrescine transport system permease protein